MQYFLRPATPTDIPSLMKLRTEAEQWLASKGSDQWSDPETGARALEKWHGTITEGRTWAVLRETGEIVATVSRGPADMDFWSTADGPEEALYIYKFIVGRSEAGRGLGDAMLDWLAHLAALEGRKWLRLDVWRAAHGLQRYYQGRGFIHVRTETPAHRFSGWLGQRPVDSSPTSFQTSDVMLSLSALTRV
jgi:ribosomal protein S18 acetylase RimI-like enzyme